MPMMMMVMVMMVIMCSIRNITSALLWYRAHRFTRHCVIVSGTAANVHFNCCRFGTCSWASSYNIKYVKISVLVFFYNVNFHVLYSSTFVSYALLFCIWGNQPEFLINRIELNFSLTLSFWVSNYNVYLDWKLFLEMLGLQHVIFWTHCVPDPEAFFY